MAGEPGTGGRRESAGPTPRPGGAATQRDTGSPRQSPSDKAIRPGQGGLKTK